MRLITYSWNDEKMEGETGTVSLLDIVNGPQFANSWLITPNLGIVFPCQVIKENTLINWRYSTAAVVKLKSMVIRGKSLEWCFTSAIPLHRVESRIVLGKCKVTQRAGKEFF